MAAITDPYADTATYRSVIDKSDAGDDADILTDLTAVSRYLDRTVGRFFTRDAAPVARIFTPRPGRASRPDWADSENPWKYGGATRTLFIDDAVSVSSIIIDLNRDGLFTDAPLAATDYELLPRNAPLGPEPAPYESIELTSWGNIWCWPPYARVQVTGVWGWPAVPAAIVRATCHLTAILRLETPRAQASVNELGQLLQMSAPAVGIVRDLAQQYGKLAF